MPYNLVVNRMAVAACSHGDALAARRPIRWSATAVFVGLLAYATATMWAVSPALAIVNLMTAAAFALTARLLSAEVAQRANARLFAVTAVLWVIDSLTYSTFGPLPVLSQVMGPLMVAAAATVMLRYPETRTGLIPRRFLFVLSSWIAVGRLAWVLTTNGMTPGYSPSVWWPTVVDDQQLHTEIGDTFDIGCVVLAGTFAVLVVARLRAATGVDRRMLAPVAAAAGAGAVAVAAEMAARVVVHNRAAFVALLVVEALALVTIPLAFAAAAVRQRLAASQLADLVLRLGAAACGQCGGDRLATVESVRTELSDALGDPTLELLYWVPTVGAYFDGQGRPRAPEAAVQGRLASPVVALDGTPLAVIVTALVAERHRNRVDIAMAATRLALHNARLRDDLQAQIRDLQQSRERLVTVASVERRRLERDIHDGAQQQLVSASITLRRAQRTPDTAGTHRLLRDGADQLEHAIGDLRELVRGLHPPILRDRGLFPALTSLAERSTIPIELNAPAVNRCPDEIETCAYFVAAEAVTNAAKHAAATAAVITVDMTDTSLTLTVRDDGVGGARVSPAGGLAGLHDRVCVLGGTLTLHSPHGAGTTLTMTLPLHSAAEPRPGPT